MKRVNDMYEKIKNAKDVWSFVVSVVIAVVVSTSWVNTTFVTTTRADSMHEELTNAAAVELKKTNDQLKVTNEQLRVLAEQVKTSNNLLTLHVDQHMLESVNSDLNLIETEIFSIQQSMRLNGSGSDPQSEQRIHRLNTKKEGLTIRRDCIIANNKVCK